MSDRRLTQGTVRKLWPTETTKFRDHLLRLDRDARRLRFAHSVSDAFIIDYAGRMLENGAIVYGYVVDGEVRAAAELRRLGESWKTEAEAAFSVEAPYQSQGIGTELMGRVIRAARNRGVEHLIMSCLAENQKMQAIARKHEAELRFEYGEVVGEIVPATPNYFTLISEAVQDQMSVMLAIFDIRRRMGRVDDALAAPAVEAAPDAPQSPEASPPDLRA
jgi:GNAT superfamily N-acetyltransferase